MHAALLRHRPGPETQAGRFRQEQVWIGSGNAGPRLAEFVAPHHNRVPRAIADIGQPAVDTHYLTDALGLGEMAALRARDALTDRGVLTETTGRGRHRVWQHRGIFEVLDGYAERIRRMTSLSR